ncbi:PD-(D/E)XK nuclease family protein [Vibrio sp. EJY3]|uniref:PD-(D/E)XK nuclease family protein n=1 Tax=Vibrio sp. (strain EJY3) TaxID=1116375 RepID=UPI000243BA2F|nr:PD-(D/E)XK nuclease family protein [Vibrio sp. EJY3]AEX21551.1 hypothetical protein VEJY3_05285 [Vibrio sp. EJY3]
MDIEQLKVLLDKFRNLPETDKEKTIFDIGTRGHFENPISDVLAFFCSSEEQHGMGNLVGNSISGLITNKLNRDLPQSSRPVSASREVATEQGKRLDLVLEYDEYLIIIEAKVNHSQVNPFDEYERYGDKLGAGYGKDAFYAVLSPSGNVDDQLTNHRWAGISFNELKTAVSENLHTYFMDKPLDKWVFVLRDFLLHLENLSMTGEKNPNYAFALENMAEISKAWTLLTDSLNSINSEIYRQCEELYGNGFSHRKSTWFKPLPVFIYSLEGSSVEVILFASPDDMGGLKNEGKFLYIQIYIKKDKQPDLFRSLQEALQSKTVDFWESKDNSGTLRWPLEHDTDVVGEMMSVLNLVHETDTL